MGRDGRCTLDGGGRSPAALMNGRGYDIVDELNEEFAVLTGQSVGILQKYKDPVMERESFRIIKPADLKLILENRDPVEVPGAGGKSHFVPLDIHWRKHKRRLEYRGIVFDPTNKLGPEYYNLWRGFAVEPDPSRSCELYLAHIRNIVCGGNLEYFDYFIKWLAHAVQKTEEIPGVAVALRSTERGTGKNFTIEYFGKIFGPHFLTTSQKKHLFGQYSGHLANVLVVHGEELVWGGDHDAESVLKSLITTEMRTLESKYKDPVQVRSYLRVMLSSNGSWIVPAGGNERRFFVLDVSPEKAKDPEYFDPLFAEMRNGGPAALLYYLQNVDLTGFNVRMAPETEALSEQKLQSSPVGSFLLECLEEGALVHSKDGIFFQRVQRDLFYNKFLEWANQRKRGWNGGIKSQKELLIEIQRIIPKVKEDRPRTSSASRPFQWCFPTWEECSDAFTAYYRRTKVSAKGVEGSSDTLN